MKPDTFAASAKRLTMYCCASWMWARSAQSSANSSSTISTSMVLVCARRWRRLKILPSVLKRMRISSTKSSFASRNIKLKRMENKVKLMMKPDTFAASAKRLTMYCCASWMWARSAQSSANSSSTISTSMVLVCARRWRRLKILPSVLKRMRISSTKSSFASRNIKLKRMENKVGARTHPCLTPFAIGKLSERAPLCLTWPI